MTAPDLSFLGSGQRVLLRWSSARGEKRARTAIVQSVRHQQVVVVPDGDGPPAGVAVTFEAGLMTGLYLATGEVAGKAVRGPDLVIEVSAVERIQRRGFVRAQIDLDTMSAFLLGADGEPARRFAVRLIDLSGGGVRFECLEPLAPGQLFTIVLTMGEEEPIRPVIRVVEAALRNDEDSILSVRATFESIAERDRQRIIQLVFRLQSDARRRESEPQPPAE
ncbi:MAG: PilZ domain-containing protein [Dehalococcoidia bacterium]